MANEKSRNHEARTGDKGGNGKAQGKRESDQTGNAGSKSGTKSATGKPGPGKQARDQLNTTPRPTN